MDLTFLYLKLLKTMVAEPQRLWYCYGLARETGVQKQTAREHLRQLVDKGWLTDVGMYPSTAKRQDRHMYQLTKHGLHEGKAALAELQINSTMRSVSTLQSSRRVPSPATIAR